MVRGQVGLDGAGRGGRGRGWYEVRLAVSGSTGIQKLRLSGAICPIQEIVFTEQHTRDAGITIFVIRRPVGNQCLVSLPREFDRTKLGMGVAGNFPIPSNDYPHNSALETENWGAKQQTYTFNIPLFSAT